MSSPWTLGRGDKARPPRTEQDLDELAEEHRREEEAMSGRGVNAMPGRPEGEGSARLEEQELQEAAQRQQVDRELDEHHARRPGFFARIFRRRGASPN